MTGVQTCALPICGRDQQRFAGQRDETRADGGRRDDQGRRYDNAPRVEAERVPDEQSDRYAVTGSPVANDLGEDSPDGAEPTPVAPRRRGRPRRDVAVAAVAEGDGAPVAFDADRLPPSLSLASPPAEPDGEEEAAKPRRRRSRAVAAGEASQAG